MYNYHTMDAIEHATINAFRVLSDQGWFYRLRKLDSDDGFDEAMKDVARINLEAEPGRIICSLLMCEYKLVRIKEGNTTLDALRTTMVIQLALDVLSNKGWFNKLREMKDGDDAWETMHEFATALSEEIKRDYKLVFSVEDSDATGNQGFKLSLRGKITSELDVIGVTECAKQLAKKALEDYKMGKNEE